MSERVVLVVSDDLPFHAVDVLVRTLGGEPTESKRGVIQGPCGRWRYWGRKDTAEAIWIGDDDAKTP